MYAVRLLSGGPERTINRGDLLPAQTPFGIAPEAPPEGIPVPPEPQYPDRGDFWLGWVPHDAPDQVAAAVQAVEDPAEDPPVRRSTRANRGQRPRAYSP